MNCIVTDYWPKPVPSNQCDWSATDDNYEAETESDGHVSHSHPIGYGATELDAILEFLSMVEEPEIYDDWLLERFGKDGQAMERIVSVTCATAFLQE